VWMGLGALLVFIGVSLVSVRFIRPLAWSLGPPIRWLLTILWIAYLFLTPIGWLYQVYYRVRYKVWPTYIDRSSSAELARGDARAYGKNFFATAVNPVGGSMFKLDWKEGSQAVFSQLGADGAFTDDGYAKRHKLHIGSPITLTFSTGAKKTFVIKGVFNPPT